MNIESIIRTHEKIDRRPVVLSFPHRGKTETGTIMCRVFYDEVVTHYFIESHNLPFPQRVPVAKVQIAKR